MRQGTRIPHGLSHGSCDAARSSANETPFSILEVQPSNLQEMINYRNVKSRFQMLIPLPSPGVVAEVTVCILLLAVVLDSALLGRVFRDIAQQKEQGQVSNSQFSQHKYKAPQHIPICSSAASTSAFFNSCEVIHHESIVSTVNHDSYSQ